MTGDPHAVALPARTIGAPTTLSPEARATLGVVSPLFDEPEPHPADKDGWRRYVAEREARVADRLLGTRARYPCELSEDRLGAAGAFRIVPESLVAPGVEVLYLHGGGYTSGAGVLGAHLALPLAHHLGVVTHAVDYRLPPDHPFPAALQDALDAYDALRARLPTERIVVAGRSAGGGLAAAMLLEAQATGRPMPAACILQTPEVDLTQSGDSVQVNDGLDDGLRRLDHSVLLYADGHPLTDPRLSPLFGDFRADFPPTLLTTGTRDLFLSSTVLLHRSLRRAGIAAELHVWEAMGHQGFGETAPEDQDVWSELRRFVAGLSGPPAPRTGAAGGSAR